jgi:hypothetical protein
MTQQTSDDDRYRLASRWPQNVKLGTGVGGTSFFFVPNELIVRLTRKQMVDDPQGALDDVIEAVAELLGPEVDRERLRYKDREGKIPILLLPDGVDVPSVGRYLRDQGFRAWPNHIFFADPAGADSFSQVRPSVHANPVTFGSLANPVTFGSLANPVTFGSLANPVTFGSLGAALAGACCADCFGTYVSPTVPTEIPHQTLALAVPAPELEARSAAIGQGLRVVVLDTGLALNAYRPPMDENRVGCSDPASADDQPDPENDGLVDPAAGHGTFIASIINRMAPGAQVDVVQVLTTYGVGQEDEIGQAIDRIRVANRPDVLTMSFSSYTEDDHPAEGLTEAIQRIAAAGTIVVASAGNSASCRPAWPAAMPEVISVGALGPMGPAPFTNFGPWVKACAPGVDIVSQFFMHKPQSGAPEIPLDDHDHPFLGWAKWSGTSFSAPIVVGALLQAQVLGGTLSDAVDALINEPHLARMPGLGTIVNAYP